MKNCIRLLVCMVGLIVALSFFACKNSAGEALQGLSSISVSGTPYKTEYLTNEVFNSSGLTVTATYQSGVTKTVTNFSTNFDSLSGGLNIPLEISYSENGITKTASVSGINKASYVLTESPRILPTGTKGSVGTGETYVEFGDFPQTIMSKRVTVSSKQAGNGYYIGSDGNYYAQVRENINSSSYTYSDRTYVKLYADNSIRYFKVEPIMWWVVTSSYPGSNSKLLLAENMLTSNVPYYSGDGDKTRTIGTETIYSNNYKYSQLRAYLNGNEYYDDSGSSISTYKAKGFLQSAFTATAQSKIITTTVDNSLESTQDTKKTLFPATGFDCENTKDKIFLLSEKDVTTASYGFNEDKNANDPARIRIPTDYALANKVYLYKDFLGWGSLRSPHTDKNKVYHMNSTGESAAYILASKDDLGIVPALSVSF